MRLDKLLGAGLALVPVPLGKKNPTQGWNLRHNAVTSKEQVNLLIDNNIGLAHAYCTPSPTCAIDIDNYIGASSWLRLRGIDLKALEDAETAVVIRSGKDNSLKLLYRIPPEVGPLRTKQLKSLDGESMMLEFRCAFRNGTTTQDLIPPSIHPLGTQYRWAGRGDPLNIPTIPQPLLSIWLDLLEANKLRMSKLSGKYTTPQTPRMIATVKDLLTHIDADCDYFTWRNVCWSVQSTGWSCAIDLAKEWSESAPRKYDEDAFWSLVESYDPGQPDAHTLGTVYHHARNGGWDG